MSLDFSSCIRRGLRGRSEQFGKYCDGGALGELSYLVECLVVGSESSREWAQGELRKLEAEGRAALEGEAGE